MNRNKVIVRGLLLALSFAAALAVTACPKDDGDAVTFQVAPKTETLTLSGPVYTANISAETLPPGIVYTPYSDNLTVSDGGIGGTAAISNKQFSYVIDEPPALTPASDGLAWLKTMYSDIKFSTETVNAAALTLTITGSDEYSTLMKGNAAITMSFPSLITPVITITIESTYYVYVDEDIVITALEKNFELTELGYPISVTTAGINLKLKKGWNALYSTITAESPVNLVDPTNLDSLNLNGTLTLTVAEPASCKWTLIPQSIPKDAIPAN